MQALLDRLAAARQLLDQIAMEMAAIQQEIFNLQQSQTTPPPSTTPPPGP